MAGCFLLGAQVEKRIDIQHRHGILGLTGRVVGGHVGQSLGWGGDRLACRPHRHERAAAFEWDYRANRLGGPVELPLENRENPLSMLKRSQ